MRRLLCALLFGILILSLAGCAGAAAPAGAPSGAEGAPTKAQAGALLASYYAGQNDRAYGMLRKHIFQNVLESQAGELGMERPVWNFDTFTAYRTLDREGKNLYSQPLNAAWAGLLAPCRVKKSWNTQSIPAIFCLAGRQNPSAIRHPPAMNTGSKETDGGALYCCTFSAADGRQGYVVLPYHGGESRQDEGLSVVAAAETPYLYAPGRTWTRQPPFWRRRSWTGPRPRRSACLGPERTARLRRASA